MTSLEGPGGRDSEMSEPTPTYVPEILCGVDGEPPIFVSETVAETPDDAIAYAVSSGELVDPLGCPVSRVLMRELDPIACKIRGYEEGWWVVCTSRSKKAHPFWRIDA